jgi:hypothetical protein
MEEASHGMVKNEFIAARLPATISARLDALVERYDNRITNQKEIIEKQKNRILDLEAELREERRRAQGRTSW